MDENLDPLHPAVQAKLVHLATRAAQQVELPAGHTLHVFEYGGNGAGYEPGLVLDMVAPTGAGRSHIIPYEMLPEVDIAGEIHLILHELELGNPEPAW